MPFSCFPLHFSSLSFTLYFSRLFFSFVHLSYSSLLYSLLSSSPSSSSLFFSSFFTSHSSLSHSLLFLPFFLSHSSFSHSLLSFLHSLFLSFFSFTFLIPLSHILLFPSLFPHLPSARESDQPGGSLKDAFKSSCLLRRFTRDGTSSEPNPVAVILPPPRPQPHHSAPSISSPSREMRVGSFDMCRVTEWKRKN